MKELEGKYCILLINTSEDLMILIIGGILCYDVFMQCEFILYAYIIA